MGYVVYLLTILTVLGKSYPLQAGVEVSLPDYEREARLIYHGLCDGGSINYKTYWKKGGYVLEVATSESRDAFYMLKRYVGGDIGWHERYFVTTGDSTVLTETEHDEWDERVKHVSVNYFNKLHDLKTTCSKVLVM